MDCNAIPRGYWVLMRAKGVGMETKKTGNLLEAMQPFLFYHTINIFIRTLEFVDIDNDTRSMSYGRLNILELCCYIPGEALLSFNQINSRQTAEFRVQYVCFIIINISLPLTSIMSIVCEDIHRNKYV